MNTNLMGLVEKNKNYAEDALDSCVLWGEAKYQRVHISVLVREVFLEMSPHMEICTCMALAKRGIYPLSDGTVVMPAMAWPTDRDREMSATAGLEIDGGKGDIF